MKKKIKGRRLKNLRLFCVFLFEIKEKSLFEKVYFFKQAFCIAYNSHIGPFWRKLSPFDNFFCPCFFV